MSLFGKMCLHVFLDTIFFEHLCRVRSHKSYCLLVNKESPRAPNLEV